MSPKKSTRPKSSKRPLHSKSPAKAKTKAKAQSKPRRTGAAQFEKLLRQTRQLERYELKLYVAGASPRSGQAIANVRALCEQYLINRYDLEVIDIYQQPAVAVSEQIVAAPTLIRKLPAPSRRMIGDLSNRDKILVGLNISADAVKTSWVKL